jgi:hypothetical protein
MFSIHRCTVRVMAVENTYLIYIIVLFRLLNYVLFIMTLFT